MVVNDSARPGVSRRRDASHDLDLSLPLLHPPPVHFLVCAPDAGFEDVEVVFKGARLPVGLIDMGGEQPVSMRRNTASSTIGSGIIGSTIVSTATQVRLRSRVRGFCLRLFLGW